MNLPNLSAKSNNSAQFTIHKSVYLSRLLIGLHALGLIASLFNSLAGLYQFILIVSILSSLFYYLRNYLNYYANYTLYYAHKTGWQIQLHSTVKQPIQILGSSLLTRKAIILHIRFNRHQTETLFILHDSLLPAQFSQLTVLLKTTNTA